MKRKKTGQVEEALLCEAEEGTDTSVSEEKNKIDLKSKSLPSFHTGVLPLADDHRKINLNVVPGYTGRQR